MNNKNIIDFIYEEAFLLDTMQWERWLALYASDARYWMPMEWDQQDPIMQQSLMYEDIFLLKVRVERLSGERTFSQKPKSRCHHLLQAPKIIDQNIQATLGSYRDFVMTSLAAQNDSFGFINEVSTKRKEILAKFLDLEIFCFLLLFR